MNDVNIRDTMLNKYSLNGLRIVDVPLIMIIDQGMLKEIYSIKDNEEVCIKIIDTELMQLDYENHNLKDYKDDLINEIIILTTFSDYENSVKFYGGLLFLILDHIFVLN